LINRLRHTAYDYGQYKRSLKHRQTSPLAKRSEIHEKFNACRVLFRQVCAVRPAIVETLEIGSREKSDNEHADKLAISLLYIYIVYQTA